MSIDIDHQAADRTPRLYVPMLQAADVKPHLAKPNHWKEGYSAHALATTWFERNDLPATVRTVLDGHAAFRGAVLVDAMLERETDLRDGVRGPTHTDLLAILGIGKMLAVAAVEGKVEETFGQLVSEWLTESLERQTRLGGLVKLLGLSGSNVMALRYQLLHRTAAAVYEAERYRAATALLMVHSFSEKRSGFPDFAAFVRAMGLTNEATPGTIFGPKRVGEIDLYAGWVADQLPRKAP